MYYVELMLNWERLQPDGKHMVVKKIGSDFSEPTIYCGFYFVKASCTAIAQATDAPTIGLLPNKF